MLWFRVDIDGDREVMRAINRFTEGVEDLRGWFAEEEKAFYKREARLFKSQGGDAGGWEPLSPLYAAKKAEHFPGKPIMELSGELKRSFTTRGAPGQVRHMTRTELELGSKVPHAAVHHRGTSARMWIPAPFYMWIKGLPQRPLIVLKKEQKREMGRRLQKYLVALWGGDRSRAVGVRL